jgi:hypothetical protein
MFLKDNLKKIMVLTVVLLGFSVKAQILTYENWFTKDVLRIDLSHSGDVDNEYYFTEQFYKEKVWAGAYTKLIDKTGYGDNYFEVYDSTSQKLIYSRGYNNLFYEWQETAEAKVTNRSFEEVIRCPFPLKTVEIKIYRRQKDGELVQLHELFINPKHYRINKGARFNFETERIHGKLESNKAVDVVIIAEGYTSEEMDLFRKEAKSLSSFLLNTEPFNRVKDKFNIWLVLSESNESGTDIPGKDIWKNTIVNSHFYTFNSERYLTSQSIKTIHDLASLVPYDQVYVLVNSDKYGGGGIFNYYNLTSAHHELSPWVFIHEFGHGFAGLADEYYDGSTAYNDIYDLNSEPWRPNITTLAHPEKKWKSKVDKNTPIPTPPTKENINKIGFYEGGGYVEKGIYRAYQNCEMKALQQGFCPVCQDAILMMVDFNIDK